MTIDAIKQPAKMTRYIWTSKIRVETSPIEQRTKSDPDPSIPYVPIKTSYNFIYWLQKSFFIQNLVGRKYIFEYIYILSERNIGNWNNLTEAIFSFPIKFAVEIVLVVIVISLVDHNAINNHLKINIKLMLFTLVSDWLKSAIS